MQPGVRALFDRRPSRSRAARRPTTSASSPDPGSMPRGAWRTCRSASPACLPTTMRPQTGSRANWIASTANGAKSKRRCRNRRWPPSTSIVAGDAYTICIYRADWHQGVVGLVASRLKDRFHRPVIVFAPGADGELRGSGRTIGGFHLRDALDLVAKRSPRHHHPLWRTRLRGGPDAAGQPHCLVSPQSSSASRANGCRRRHCARPWKPMANSRATS